MRWDDSKSYEKKDGPVYGWDEKENERNMQSVNAEEDEAEGDITVFGIVPDEAKSNHGRNHILSNSASKEAFSSGFHGNVISTASHKHLHSSSSTGLSRWQIAIISALICIFGCIIMVFAGKLIAAVAVIIAFIYLIAIS